MEVCMMAYRRVMNDEDLAQRTSCINVVFAMIRQTEKQTNKADGKRS